MKTINYYVTNNMKIIISQLDCTFVFILVDLSVIYCKKPFPWENVA